MTDEIYVKIDGYWFNLTTFKNHPGGINILKKYNLRDATKAFNEAKHIDGFVLLLMEQFEVKDYILIQKLNNLQY